MTPQKEEAAFPISVGAEGKTASIQQKSHTYSISILPVGQAVKIASIYAWMPCIEMLLPALVVAFMGAIR